MNRILNGSAAALIVAVCAGSAHAGVLFADDFNSYAYQLNWSPASNWTVASGSVDLIGETTSGTAYDFFPGNGGFVDLDGWTNEPGALATTQTFGPGTYTLSFQLGGNQRDDGSKTTTISLGDFSKSLSLDADAGLTTYAYTFTTKTSGQLTFADLAGGNQNIGNILDNVSLSAGGVPEPATWAAMLIGFGGIGAALRGSRRKQAAAAG